MTIQEAKEEAAHRSGFESYKAVMLTNTIELNAVNDAAMFIYCNSQPYIKILQTMQAYAYRGYEITFTPYEKRVALKMAFESWATIEPLPDNYTPQDMLYIMSMLHEKITNKVGHHNG